jgi:hypothetical protein
VAALAVLGAPPVLPRPLRPVLPPDGARGAAAGGGAVSANRPQDTSTCQDIKTQKIIAHPDLTKSVVAVDEEQGTVLLWMNFGDTGSYGAGNALIVYEGFKVFGGQLHAVEAFMKVLPKDTPRGWGRRSRAWNETGSVARLPIDASKHLYCADTAGGRDLMKRLVATSVVVLTLILLSAFVVTTGPGAMLLYAQARARRGSPPTRRGIRC